MRQHIGDSAGGEAAHREFLDDVLNGLAQKIKTIPCKYFYDEEGSRLFDAICALDEYYPTRTELTIMERHAREMATRIGPGCQLIEYGAGSGLKTRILLDHLGEDTVYMPVDISCDYLWESSEKIDAEFDEVRVVPVCADFTDNLDLPDPDRAVRRRVVYFPGSTIGNFDPQGAGDLLRGIVELVGPGGGLLIGVDLKKDRHVLERAYNDSRSVTGAFNKNLLKRINGELGADFDLDGFEHRAVWDDKHGRIEMRLISVRDQTVRLDGVEFSFSEGEHIVTEHSHKYAVEQFAAIAAEAGLTVVRTWTDPDGLFSVQYLEVPR